MDKDNVKGNRKECITNTRECFGVQKKQNKNKQHLKSEQ
ncbi:unnamed protein product [Tenebrio molitor]|nr:unnamed protein product [Tenebrio molitor]